MRAWWLAAAVGLAGCDNMVHQPHRQTLDPDPLMENGASFRTPPAHTVAVGSTPDSPIATGKRNGVWIDRIPVPITADLLRRGRDRFDAACSECHGLDGYGSGIVVRRGFPAPPSYHDPRLRGAPAGELFGAILQGYGVMYPATDRVPPADRWAVVAYIRALQLSQHARLADLPPQERQRLEAP